MMNPTGAVKGMLLRAQPIFDTIEKIDAKNSAILLDPAGRRFDQAFAEELAREEELDFHLWSLRRAMTSASRPW